LLGLELGHGTLAALMAIRDPHHLDALLFSHLHPDHCADVAAMTVYRRYYPPAGPRGKLAIYAPSEAHSRFVAAYSPAAAEPASGVDVLLSEASWTHADDRPPDLHMSGTEAGEVAKRAGVGKLLLTHVSPFTDNQAILAEARAAFPGEIELVRQGSSYPI